MTSTTHTWPFSFSSMKLATKCRQKLTYNRMLYINSEENGRKYSLLLFLANELFGFFYRSSRILLLTSLFLFLRGTRVRICWRIIIWTGVIQERIFEVIFILLIIIFFISFLSLCSCWKTMVGLSDSTSSFKSICTTGLFMVYYVI